MPQTIERWKLELIRRRAVRCGLRSHDLADAVQEVALAVMNFTFQAERSNGASEKTALTALVDRRLAMIRRRTARYRRRFEALEWSPDASQEQAEPTEPSGEPQLDTVADTQAVVARLSPEDQQLCRLLSEGLSTAEIARRMGCGWHTIKRRMERLRAEFERMGFE